jgi:SAM-dependent methyltransferase
MSYAVIDSCRVCGSRELGPVLSLGDHPLANALKRHPDEDERRYPLTLLFCPACGLVQIAETVDKTTLFSHYVWVTGTSATARRFAGRFAELVTEVRPLSGDDLVIEIASNDGTFLTPFIERGVRAIGVDPAANVAAMANAAGVPTRCAFWNSDTARDIVAAEGQAAVVVARNVIAHVSELHDVIAGIHAVLREDGIAAVEFHAAPDILAGLQYDSIYHEHLCYFSATAFAHLMQGHGLHPFHVDFSPISGGAQIIYSSRTARPPSAAYAALLDRERTDGVTDAAAWQRFGQRCLAHRDQSRELAARFAGRTVIGFGASARSATYLNFCGFTVRQIAAVIDNAPLKHGCFTPGSTIPIVTADDGFAMDPGVLFILAWNFQDEIVDLCRQRGYRGDFLIPFPDAPHLVPARVETLR